MNEISSSWPADVPAGTTAVDLFYCEGAGALVVVVHDREMNHHIYFRGISGQQPYRPLVERTGTKDSFLDALPDPAGNCVYYLGYGEHSSGEGWDFNGVFRVSIGGKPECLVSSADFGGEVLARGFASKLLGFDSSGQSLFTVIVRHENGPTGTRVRYSVARLDLSSKRFHPICDLATPFM